LTAISYYVESEQLFMFPEATERLEKTDDLVWKTECGTQAITGDRADVLIALPHIRRNGEPGAYQQLGGHPGRHTGSDPHHVENMAPEDQQILPATAVVHLPVSPHNAKSADVTSSDQSVEGMGGRVQAPLVGYDHLAVMALGGRDDDVGVGKICSHWLLDEDVRTGFDGRGDHGYALVEPPRANCHEAQALTRQHLAITLIAALRARAPERILPPIRVRVGHGHDIHAREIEESNVNSVAVVASTGVSDDAGPVACRHMSTPSPES
jgi:hypothetical protein